MKIIKIILFLIYFLPGNITAMAEKRYDPFYGKEKTIRPLSTYVSFESLPNETDCDKTIVRAIKNLSIITVEGKKHIEIDPLKRALDQINRNHEIEILKQKEHYQAKEYDLNNQLIELSRYKIASLESQSKQNAELREYQKQTFFHRYPIITWGLGVSFGIAISLGLFKLCNWVQ